MTERLTELRLDPDCIKGIFRVPKHQLGGLRLYAARELRALRERLSIAYKRGLRDKGAS